MAKATESRPIILTIAGPAIVGPTGGMMEDRIFSPRDPDE